MPALLALALPTVAAFAHPAFAQSTERVSVANDGTPADQGASSPSISRNAREVAFSSFASNLSVDDANGASDIYVRDREAGETSQVNRGPGGVAGNINSSSPSISADGLVVAFDSQDTNLVTGDLNGQIDVFVHDRATGQTVRASVSSNGTEGDGLSISPAISGDGRFVAFHSIATSLVAGDTNGTGDVFVHDLVNHTTERISVSSAGVQSNEASLAAAVDFDGRYVAFESSANNLVGGDTNDYRDIFVRDRFLGTTERVSVATTGAQSDRGSAAPAISADGRFVVFESTATNLVNDDNNGAVDVFLHDRLEGRTELLSQSANGTLADGPSIQPAISPEGRFVVFRTEATNLVGVAPTNGLAAGNPGYLVLLDRLTGELELISTGENGAANASSAQGRLAGEARAIAFTSLASNLVPAEFPPAPGGAGVFLRVPQPPAALPIAVELSPDITIRGSNETVQVRAFSRGPKLLEATAFTQSGFAQEPGGTGEDNEGDPDVFDLELLGPLHDDGLAGDETADDGVFNGVFSLAPTTDDDTPVVVRAILRNDAGLLYELESTPNFVGFVPEQDSDLADCQAWALSQALMFGHDPVGQFRDTKSGDATLPYVPFLNLGWFQGADLDRATTVCDPAGVERLLTALIGGGVVPTPNPLAPGVDRWPTDDQNPSWSQVGDAERPRQADPDDEPKKEPPTPSEIVITELAKRIGEELETIGADDCLDSKDKTQLRRLRSLMFDIFDRDLVRQLLEEKNYAGDLDEAAAATALFRGPAVSLINGLLEALDDTKEDDRHHPFRRKPPRLEKICWKAEDDCLRIEIWPNHDFSLRIFGPFNYGLILDFFANSAENPGRPIVLLICPDQNKNYSLHVDQGSVRVQFIRGLFGLGPYLKGPEWDIEDFFVDELALDFKNSSFRWKGWLDAGNKKGETYEGGVQCPGDRDCDGMRDDYESRHPCLDADRFDANDDPDGDGIPNLREQELRLDPCLPDQPPDAKGTIGGLEDGLPATGPEWIDLRDATFVETIRDSPGREVEYEYEMELYEPVPTAPDAEFASWHFVLDLDGRSDTGKPGNSRSAGFYYPELGVDAKAELRYTPQQGFTTRLLLGPQLTPTAEATSRLIDDRAGNSRPRDRAINTAIAGAATEPLLTVSILEPGNKILMRLPAGELEAALATLTGAPFEVDPAAMRFVAATEYCAPGDSCQRTIGDVLPRDLYEPLTCLAANDTMCLNEERFEVEVRWQTQDTSLAPAAVIPLNGDTGTAWFFSENNLELLVKVLDACSFADRFWVFAGGLTNVGVELRVRDTWTNVIRTYSSPVGQPFAPLQDTDAFATCPTSLPASSATATGEDRHPSGANNRRVRFTERVDYSGPSSAMGLRGAAGAGCDNQALCLAAQRFRVEVAWLAPQGTSGPGRALPLTDDTGAFWFFGEDNLEILVKVLDACSFADRFWVFAGGLTNVAVELRVTDTQSNEVRTYRTLQGAPFSPIQDTAAFATCP